MTFKGYRYPKELILLSVRWYLRYGLSYHDLEEVLADRGLGPDHRRYLYRAVDKWGQTIDFLLTRYRDRNAVLGFLKKATGQNGVPSLINIDKSGANTVGIEDFNKQQGREEEGGIEVRQCKYLNNAVEQAHRFIKKRTLPTLGFKKFDSAQVVLGETELLHRIRKGQLAPRGLGAPKTAADQFYQLAA